MKCDNCEPTCLKCDGNTENDCTKCRSDPSRFLYNKKCITDCYATDNKYFGNNFNFYRFDLNHASIYLKLFGAREKRNHLHKYQ